MSSVAVVSLDLHKKFSKAVVMDAEGNTLDERKISHASHAEMERFFEEFEEKTDVVMEATFNWPWVADLAEKCGLTPHLGDPMRVKHFRMGLPKSDRKDAIGQGTLWLRNMFPEAYLASKDVRRRRALFRMRALFVRMRTALKNNVHGQLFKLGITIDETSKLFSVTGRKILRTREMDEGSRTELSRKLALLDDLELHIARLNRAIKEEVKESEDAKLLDTLPGFAEITSHGVLGEMGVSTRFPNGRAFASYGGGLPIDNESAGKDMGKRTGIHCNRFLRWIVLEAVSDTQGKRAGNSGEWGIHVAEVAPSCSTCRTIEYDLTSCFWWSGLSVGGICRRRIRPEGAAGNRGRCYNAALRRRGGVVQRRT